jgi:hypothetical protein
MFLPIERLLSSAAGWSFGISIDTYDRPKFLPTSKDPLKKF